MSFKENAYQQMSFTDSFSGLTAREQKALEKSWAKVFADEIFPAIDEKRFAVLYSDKASRPNTPVNVIVGALIIKELFDYSDDEMVENLMLDFRIQYALHTTSFQEQPLSDKTLSRFRKRCYDYETLHNKDLYHDCVKDLSASIAKLMGISGKIRRMDSMMIESNIRRLSRMELIYTCISRLAMHLIWEEFEGLQGHLCRNDEDETDMGIICELFALSEDGVICIEDVPYDPSRYFPKAPILTANGFSQPDKTKEDYRQELEEFIASTDGRGYYEFNVTSLRPGECKWLCCGMLIRPVDGKVVVDYQIHSKYSSGDLSDTLEMKIS